MNIQNLCQAALVSLLAITASVNGGEISIGATNPTGTSTTTVAGGTLTLSGTTSTVATNPAGTSPILVSGGTLTLSGTTSPVATNPAGTSPTTVAGGTLTLSGGISTVATNPGGTSPIILSGGTLTFSGTTGADPTLTTGPSVLTSLSMSGYRFSVGTIVPPPGPPGTVTPDFIGFGPLSFSASFVLANHTTSDIDFMVPRPVVPMGAMPIYVPNVVFRVYDKTEKLVWESWTDPGTLKPVPAILSAGSSWTQTVQVPLRLDDHWLAGRYVLVASVLGAPEFNATATFEVVPATAANTFTGIKGLAVEGPIVPVDGPGVPNEKPLAAVIDIAGPLWVGPIPPNVGIGLFHHEVKTDSKGHFSVALAPGTYQVTGEPPNPSAPFPHSSTQTVTVTAGHTTEIIVHYDTGIR